MSLERIAIVGAGAWGTALANAVVRAGRAVTLAGRDGAHVEAMARTRLSRYLPGSPIDARVACTALEALAPAAQDAILLAVPAQQSRAALAAIAARLPARLPVIACAKGIERSTRKFMTEVIADCAPAARPAILSGPGFAEEVARGLPTAVTLAAGDEQLAATLARALGSATFRPYHSTDVRGVEIGGAAKNVFAIATGIVAGRRLGASAAAALTTRGFAELARFGTALGARPETLTGLSGLGDLILTCASAQSRNFSLGVALGRGEAPARRLAEGAFTAAVVVELAQRAKVEMPIAIAIAAILDGSLNVDQAIENLLTRPFRKEG